MSPSKADDRDPVEVLAEDFLEQHRRGKNPSIAEYVARYPDLAHEIRDLFPAVLAMERLKSHVEPPHPPRASLGARKLERLGDFRLLSEIGRGGMGVVYEALHESLARHVAVKVLPRQSDRQARSFLKEARTVARLHHTNIVPVFGVGEQDGYQYIVMQLIRGVDLDAVLEALQNLGTSANVAMPDPDLSSGSAGGQSANDSVRLARALLGNSSAASSESAFGPSSEDTLSAADSLTNTLAMRRSSDDSSEEFTAKRRRGLGRLRLPSVRRPGNGDGQHLGSHYWQRIASIGRQAADALEYAHLQRILHRDIKPANLILDAQGVVWITDFGLAKAMDESHGSHAGSLAGTLRFMAPEQFSGECDHRSDIYGLGLTLYELLTLQPAFSDSSRSNLIRKITQERPLSMRHFCPRLPKDLEAIVMKSIARNPDDRYQSASEMARDLERFLDDRPVTARPMSSLERTWRWARRNRAVAAMSGTAAIFLLTTAMFASAEYFQRTRALEIQSLLRSQADVERLRTEANLRLAAKAFDDVFGRITGTPVSPSLDSGLEQEPSDDAARAVLNEREVAILKGLLAFYDEFARQNENDVRWQRETARAFRRAGELQYRLGNNQEANDSLCRALNIFETLLVNDPTNVDLISKTAMTRTRLANIAWEMGRGDIALSESRQAWQDLLKSPGILETSAACRIELARAYNQYALALAQFRFPSRMGPGTGFRRTDPREYLQRSIEIADSLLGESPGNLDYCLTMAESYRCLWWLETQRKQSEAASQARERTIDLLAELVSNFPDEPECRAMLVEVYLAPFRFAAGGKSLQKGAGEIQKAFQIAADLADQFPQVHKYQLAYAQSLAVMSRLSRELDQDDASLNYLSRAIEIQKVLLEQQPARGRFRPELIRMMEERVRLVREVKPTELRAALEQLTDVIDDIPAQFQLFPPYVRSTVKAYAELAEVLKSEGQTDAARAALDKGNAIAARAQARGRRGSSTPPQVTASSAGSSPAAASASASGSNDAEITPTANDSN